MSKSVCALCGNEVESTETLYGPSGGIRTAWGVLCHTCGAYNVTMLQAAAMPSLTRQQRSVLSGATRSAFEVGDRLELSSASVPLLLRTPNPSPVEAVNLVLEYVARRSATVGKPVPLDAKRDYPLAYAEGEEGFRFIVNSMLNDGLIERTETSASPHYRLTMRGYERIEANRKEKLLAASTIWPRVDRALKEARGRLDEATNEEQFQVVGLLCREALISLADAIHDPNRHPTADGMPASSTDAKRRLDAYVAVELPGKGNEAARAVMRNAVQLADALQHKRSADHQAAHLCLEVTTAAITFMAIIAGKRDRT